MSLPGSALLVAAFTMFALHVLAQKVLSGTNFAPRSRYRRVAYAMGIVASVAVGMTTPGTVSAVTLAVLIAALCVCSITDVETGYVLDVVTFPVLIGELAAAPLSAGLEASVQGALACAAPIGALYCFTFGRGIGLGDLKLAACIGAGLGPLAGLTAIGAAFIVGGIHGVALLATRQVPRGCSLRFAPYMALGCAASLLWSRAIWG